MENSIKNKTFGGVSYKSERLAVQAYCRATIDSTWNGTRIKKELILLTKGDGFSEHLLSLCKYDLPELVSELLGEGQKNSYENRVYDGQIYTDKWYALQAYCFDNIDEEMDINQLREWLYYNNAGDGFADYLLELDDITLIDELSHLYC